MSLNGRNRAREFIRRPKRWAALLCVAVGGGCTSPNLPPLLAIDRKVDLERFMGDWYVIGFIPVSVPFFSEEGAHNGVESYRLTEQGIIETTYTFRKGSFDGPEKRMTPKGWVHDEETNAEWRMQFLWPFEAAYLIVYLDEDYRRTIIGVPNRKYVWIMSRDPELSNADYDELLDHVARIGYDRDKVQRVPQRWPVGKGD